MKFAAAALLLSLLASPALPADPQLAERVRAELLFSWRAYEQYAWGHDELFPAQWDPKLGIHVT